MPYDTKKDFAPVFLTMRTPNTLMRNAQFEARTIPELIALAKVAAKYDGLYASHIRNEATEIFNAIDEILEIARRCGRSEDAVRKLFFRSVDRLRADLPPDSFGH